MGSDESCWNEYSFRDGNTLTNTFLTMVTQVEMESNIMFGSRNV
jgi:hypothetical protein